MKSFAILAALAGLIAAQDLPSNAPGATPPGCTTNYPGTFEITVVKPSNTKRDLAERQATQCGSNTGLLTITGIHNGMMQDSFGRYAYIASGNSQFQFDNPIQAGGEYSVGWAVCPNNSIALGGTTLFRQCASGNIANLYLQNDAGQCQDVNINIIPCSGATGTPAPASTTPTPSSVSNTTFTSASVPATTAAPTSSQIPVSIFTDGQPQATASPTSIATAAGAVSAANFGLFGGALLAFLAMF